MDDGFAPLIQLVSKLLKNQKLETIQDYNLLSGPQKARVNNLINVIRLTVPVTDTLVSSN